MVPGHIVNCTNYHAFGFDSTDLKHEIKMKLRLTAWSLNDKVANREYVHVHSRFRILFALQFGKSSPTHIPKDSYSIPEHTTIEAY